MRSIFATAAACVAIPAAQIPPYQLATIVELGAGPVPTIGKAEFIFDPLSTASDVLGQMVLSPSGGGNGRWLRYEKFFDLKISVDSTIANNAALVTVPVGFKLALSRPFLEVVTPFTGGTASAIGVNSNYVAASAAGAILGGASGEVAATLIAGYRGNLGTALIAELSASGQPIVLEAGGTLRWNRIVDAFTAGAGFLHVPVKQIAI